MTIPLQIYVSFAIYSTISSAMFTVVYLTSLPTLLKRLLAPLIVWLALTPAISASADVSAEAAVRAAMIFNLLKFAKWPETLADDATLHICAIDASAGLVAALQPLEQRSVGQHALKTKIASADALAVCEVIVTDAAQIPYPLSQVQKRSILTIGEAGFIDRGGMVGITVIDNRVRFEINLEAMKRSGISLPSQVLQLAARTR